MRCRFVGIAVVLTLAAGAPASADARVQPDLNAIGALAQEAQTRYDTADYAGAVALWTEAYAALPEEPAYAQQRSALVYQIAQASVEAYEMDPQASHLRRAERLFCSYLETIDPSDSETVAELEVTLADLREKIAAVEPDSPVQPEGGAVETTPAPEDAVELETPEVVPETSPSGPSTEDRSGGRGLTIAGGVVLGLGVAGLGAMTYGLVWGGNVDERGDAAMDASADAQEFIELREEGETANRLALGAGIASGIAVAVGASLLGVGLRRRRTSRLARGGQWAPLGWVGGGGVSWSLRF